MINIESVRLKKADELRTIADELITIYPIETKTFKFKTASLNLESSAPDLIDKISLWEKQQKSIFIYYFFVSKNADLEIVHKKITDAKTNKLGERSYPRIHSPSKYLYAGSSKSISNRIKEHLGFGHKDTYAMNLEYWCSDLNLDVDIVCMRFNPEIKKEIIQALEDGLWDHLKPLLGRRGAR